MNQARCYGVNELETRGRGAVRAEEESLALVRLVRSDTQNEVRTDCILYHQTGGMSPLPCARGERERHSKSTW